MDVARVTDDVQPRPGSADVTRFVRGVSAHLEAHDRIVELGADDASLARQLAENGRHRYLSLVADEHLERVRGDAGELAHRVHPLSLVTDLAWLDADVLVLQGTSSRLLWPPRLLGVRKIVVPTDSIEGRIAAVVQRSTGCLRHIATVDADGPRYLIFENPTYQPHPKQARVRLSPAIGYDGLLAGLDERGVQAVVLRWFEDLPHIDPGEDIDLLVADDDVDTVRSFIAEEPGLLPVDLYSVSGVSGSDREGLPCYPPALAEQILADAVRHPSGAWVPAPVDHFRSMAYHAAYHKGGRAGVPSSLVETDPASAEHDYATVLADLAAAVGVEAPKDLERLDDHLGDIGWRPPTDTLRRLSTTNQWVHRRYFDDESPSADPGQPEMAVFLIRRRALETVTAIEIEHVLDHLGFEVLMHQPLDQTSVDRCRQELRGGNWGRGPYPTSGGVPTHVIVTLHYGPSAMPDPWYRERYPHLTNFETLVAKETLRDLVNGRLPEEQACNPVHSSDNEVEAWQYVDLAIPEHRAGLESMITERCDAYRTPLPVLATLSRGRRAKVELVEVGGVSRVRKTFAPPFLRHMERELDAHHRLAGLPGTPEVIDAGDGWIDRPYYEDRLRYEIDHPVLVPLTTLRQMVTILSAVHDAGYAVIDAKPDNFVTDGDGLVLIDTEFLYAYPGAPPVFEESYSWHGPPDEVETDRPVGGFSYDERWRPWTGLSVEMLCHGSPAQQRVARVRLHARRYLRRIVRRTLAVPRRGIRAVRRGLRGAYHRWSRHRARTFAPHS